MDDIKAAEILKSLAAGMDPAAGQPLNSIASLQSPANRGRRRRTSACWLDSTSAPGSMSSPRRTSARVQALRHGW